MCDPRIHGDPGLESPAQGWTIMEALERWDEVSSLDRKSLRSTVKSVNSEQPSRDPDGASGRLGSNRVSSGLSATM